MAVSDLSTATFWQELAERAARQAAQTFLPIVAAVVAGGHPFNVEAVAISLAVAAGLTILKAVAGLQLHPGEAWYWQVVDRALPAAAGVALGFIPVDAANIVAVDWSRVAYSSLGAAVLALLSFYVTPPAAAHTSE